MQAAEQQETGLTPTQSLTVRVADNKRLFEDFLRVPRHVYADDPYYVHRPVFEMRNHLSARNPYLKKISICYFVAYNDIQPIGRICAHLPHDSKTGHFGFIDGTRPAVLQALLTKAEEWLSARGATKIMGPYSLSINDEAGLLVNGFESRPRLLMNYANPWYAETLQKSGYHKAKDLIAYEIEVEKDLPHAAQRMADQTDTMESVTTRALNMRAFKQDLSLVTDIFNDAWSNNWGFTPMSSEDVAYMAKNMKPVIISDMARLAFVDNEPAAMIIALPDVNEALQGLGGRMLPFNWIKFLWRLKVKDLSCARILLMGIRKQYSKSPLSAGLAALLISELREAAEKHGFRHVEMSWVLEDNSATDRLIRMAGGKSYKTYRIFEKDIAR